MNKLKTEKWIEKAKKEIEPPKPLTISDVNTAKIHVKPQIQKGGMIFLSGHKKDFFSLYIDIYDDKGIKKIKENQRLSLHRYTWRKILENWDKHEGCIMLKLTPDYKIEIYNWREEFIA